VWQEGNMQRRTETAMRFWRRRRRRRLDSLAMVLVELEELASRARGREPRVTLRF
jgi:hypothetical protein